MSAQQNSSSGVRRLLDILKVRNYSLLLSSGLFVGLAEHMEALILAWLILEETNSPFFVGLLSSMRWAGMASGVFFGAAADRFSKRMLLLSIQVVLIAMAVGMLIVLSLPTVLILPIMIFTLTRGFVRALDLPLRTPLMADALPRHQLPNSIPLNSLAMNITSAIGPFFGGMLFSLVGVQISYSVVVVMLILSTVCVGFLTKLNSTGPNPGESPWRTIANGFLYVKKSDILFGSLIMVFIFNSTALTLPFALMPVFARDVLNSDASGLGALMLMMGLGGLASSAVMAPMGSMHKIGGAYILWFSLIWHLGIVLFSILCWVTGSFLLAAITLFFVGAAQNGMMIGVHLVLLRDTEPSYRGRVMGLRGAAVTPLVFFSLIAGILATFLGSPLSMILICVLGIIATCGLTIALPGMRRSKPLEF